MKTSLYQIDTIPPESSYQLDGTTGNGLDDIAGRNDDTGAWYVAMGQEGGTFTTKRWETWNPAVTWEDVLAGDFNNDGKSDLVARVGGEDGNGSVRVSLSSGSRFNSARWETWNPAVDWAHVVVGNFAPAAASLYAAYTPSSNSQLPTSSFQPDADFQPADRSGELEAQPGRDVVHRIHLLTTVMHEMGHLLGHEHAGNGLMQPTLAPGVRWLPADDEASLLAGEQSLLDDDAVKPARRVFRGAGVIHCRCRDMQAMASRRVPQDGAPPPAAGWATTPPPAR